MKLSEVKPGQKFRIVDQEFGSDRLKFIKVVLHPHLFVIADSAEGPYFPFVYMGDKNHQIFATHVDHNVEIV